MNSLINLNEIINSEKLYSCFFTKTAEMNLNGMPALAQLEYYLHSSR